MLMAPDVITATHQQVTKTSHTEHEGFMTMLMAAAGNGTSIEHIAKLMELKEQHEQREAEKAFNTDYARMSAEIPRVPRNGVVSLKRDGKDLGSYNFARLEDIDRAVRPIMARYGFSITFDAQPRLAEGGGVIVTGYLRHESGHSISASIDIALDSGPGRSNNQARGGSVTFGRRYVTEMLLNIVREGADTDDAQTTISAEQALQIESLIAETGTNTAAFLEIYGAQSVIDLPVQCFNGAVAMLNKKRGKK